VFLAASFFNALVIEIGRKVRAPADEERGVTTYSVAWGVRGAMSAWLLTLLVTAVFALLAAARIDALASAGTIAAVLVAAAGATAWRFLRQPSQPGARLIGHLSAVWALLMYVSLGIVPLLMSKRSL
jgi:4-hydroxybenzoate polyprenyltransferase